MKIKILKTRSLVLFICFLSALLSFGLGVGFQWRYSALDTLLKKYESIHGKGSVSVYNNEINPVTDPRPIFSLFPQFIAPINGESRYCSSPLVQDDQASLHVQTWRYSYNARGIIEIPNMLDGNHTAIIIVHPWGVDDGQGFSTPAPAGVSFFCTPEKNKLYLEHTRIILAPFLDRMRDHVNIVVYSLPGKKNAIRSKMYSSIDKTVSLTAHKEAVTNLKNILTQNITRGNPIPRELTIYKSNKVTSYFKKFPGLDASDYYNGNNYRYTPIPLVNTIGYHPDDMVIYDQEGYYALKSYLKTRGIKHILLGGYALDLCVKKTTAGYENLKKDFNVIVVGDLTLSTFPAQQKPNMATTVELAKISLHTLITETSWISYIQGEKGQGE